MIASSWARAWTCLLPVPTAPAARCAPCGLAGWPSPRLRRRDGLKTLMARESALCRRELFPHPRCLAEPACFSEPPRLPGAFTRRRGATRHASRRGFRGISSVATLPAVFHDRETPSVMPACNPTETPREALRARALQPKNEAAPKSRQVHLPRRGNHGSRNEHRHNTNTAGLCPAPRRSHQKAGAADTATEARTYGA